MMDDLLPYGHSEYADARPEPGVAGGIEGLYRASPAICIQQKSKNGEKRRKASVEPRFGPAPNFKPPYLPVPELLFPA
jgi:hypothetical protein